MLSLLSAVFLASAAVAHPVNEDFYQPRDSPITELFRKRAPSPSDSDFASHYPPGWTTPPASMIPQAWKDKFATIQMPDVPVSSPNNGYPTYSNGKRGDDPSICSFTYACVAQGDLYNAPDGIWAVTFDDGPGPSSPKLNEYLCQNNISSSATHFMIGGNILGNPTGMQDTANAGGHIGVHTWSHQYMTSMSNEDVMSELGWTMQIISDLNNGRLPKYWRPPFGDVDNRVRAIAKGVFGLETVTWNQDTGDWAIGNNAAYTEDSVKATMEGWFKGKKSPGICSLEHELNDHEFSVFQYAYPVARDNGWKMMNVADAWGMPWYIHAATGSASVNSMAVGSGPGTMTAAAGAAGNSSTLASRSMPMSGSGSGSGSASGNSSISSMSSAPASASVSGSITSMANTESRSVGAAGVAPTTSVTAANNNAGVKSGATQTVGGGVGVVMAGAAGVLSLAVMLL